MNDLLIYKFFRDGGRIKPDSTLYKHVSKRDIHLGVFLGYLSRRGTSLEDLEEEWNCTSDDIISWMETFNKHRHFEREMAEQGYQL